MLSKDIISEADMFGTEETYDSSNSIVKYLVQNT